MVIFPFVSIKSKISLMKFTYSKYRTEPFVSARYISPAFSLFSLLGNYAKKVPPAS